MTFHEIPAPAIDPQGISQATETILEAFESLRIEGYREKHPQTVLFLTRRLR